jgi:hypothetical protein
MADNIRITGKNISGPQEGDLEKMWRKFLRNPNLQNAQIFDVMLNNQFPQATNFIPTGKQKSVRSPKADSGHKKFEDLQVSIVNRAAKDLNASRQAFRSGNISSAYKLYERGMYGVSESGHLSKLSQYFGQEKTGALRFLQTREKMVGAELGGGNGVPGKQLKVLEQILSALKKNTGTKPGGKGSAATTAKPGGKGSAAATASSRRRGYKFLGGIGSILGDVEDLAALSLIDPVFAVGAIGAFAVGKLVKGYRGAYRMITPAMNTLIAASQVSRLLGMGGHTVLAPLNLSGKSAKVNKFYHPLGYSPQELLAIEGAYGVPGNKVPMHLLATLGRTKYLGGLPTTEIAGMMQKLVGIGHTQAMTAGKILVAITTAFGKRGVSPGIAAPAFMSVFGSAVSSNAPGINELGLYKFAASFLKHGGPGARTGSLQNQIYSGLQRMASNPNAVQMTLGEGLLFGGVSSFGGMMANVHKYMGKGSVKFLNKVFSHDPLYKTDIDKMIRGGFPLSSYLYLMTAFKGDPQALTKLVLSESKSFGLSKGLVPLLVSKLANIPLTAALAMLSTNKVAPLEDLKIYKKSLAGQVGKAQRLTAEKAALGLEISYKALQIFGPTLEFANKVILDDLIPTVDELAKAFKNLLDKTKYSTSPNTAGYWHNYFAHGMLDPFYNSTK